MPRNKIFLSFGVVLVIFVTVYAIAFTETCEEFIIVSRTFDECPHCETENSFIPSLLIPYTFGDIYPIQYNSYKNDNGTEKSWIKTICTNVWTNSKTITKTDN